MIARVSRGRAALIALVTGALVACAHPPAPPAPPGGRAAYSVLVLFSA